MKSSPGPHQPNTQPLPPAPELQRRRPTLVPKLKKGDVIVFSISPTSTALEYDKPLVGQRLQNCSTYGKYLGIVKSSAITRTPSVVEGYASPFAPEEIELLKIAYVGRAPPGVDMLDAKGLVVSLQNQSLAFASVPVHRSHSAPTLLSHHRPPLKAVGGGTLPIEEGFVYTSFAVDAHLATFYPGDTATSLELAEGESLRLAASGSKDTTVISEARYRLHETSRYTGGDDDSASQQSTSSPPAFTRVAVDVWTGLKPIGPIGEPAEFRRELLAVESAIEEIYKEEAVAVGEWSKVVQKETPPLEQPTTLGLLFGFSTGILGSIFGRLIKIVRR